MKEENTQIVEKKESFWNKLKTLIRKIFRKENINDSEENVEDTNKNQEEKEKNFETIVKIEKDSEKERLLKLQREFRAGQINQGDLSNEDIEKLGKLYDEQIERLKIQIEECKKRIEDKKRKLQKT